MAEELKAPSLSLITGWRFAGLYETLSQKPFNISTKNRLLPRDSRPLRSRALVAILTTVFIKYLIFFSE